MKMDRVATATTNVLIVGVGGQGVIMISKVLAELCQMQGHQVKQSEVHGMAKRGGGVFSHVRFGERVWSPTIPRGEADILLALEWAEGLRWLNYLRPDRGTFIADTQQIVPPFACRDRRRGAVDAYARETPAEILELVAKGFALDAGSMAAELGNPRVANTILLGALSTALEFPTEDWRAVLVRSVPPKTKDLNLEAFEQGREWVTRAATAPAPPAPRRPDGLEGPAIEVELEIVEAWCKGCDICVKMCPERCLALNAAQVAVLTDAAACTGCGICEWLCPDFAIAVHKRSRDEVSA
jgi:indolepyruvate ferredoxin oxidoreductase beta subunit